MVARASAATGAPAALRANVADLLDRGIDSIRLMSLVEMWSGAGPTGLEFDDPAEQPVLRLWEKLVGSGA